MKRLTALALAGVLLLGTACGGGNQANDAATQAVGPKAMRKAGKATRLPRKMKMFLRETVLSLLLSESPSMTA